IVIDDEYAEFCESFGNNFAGDLCVADSEPNSEIERAARARLAFEPNASTHQFDKPPANGQTEACAAMFARGGHVCLSKGLKEFGGLLGRHTNARITDREFELHFAAGAFEELDFEADFATPGEFHGVIDKVSKYLPEAKWIAHQALGDAGSDV